MTTPDLYARLTALEQTVARLNARTGARRSEALSPTYVTLDANGLVGANFTGQVHAQGLVLDAGTTNSPANIDRIRWLRTTDGVLVANIYAYETGGSGDVLQLAVNSNIFGNQVASLSIGEGTIHGVVQGGGSFTLMDSTGRATYVQTPAPIDLQCQAASLSNIVVSAGWSTTVIPLPTAWGSQHISFVASVTPSAGASILSIEAGASGFGADLGHGFVNMNSSVMQNVIINWVSFGN